MSELINSIRKLVIENNIDTVSFDIFDTLVFRKVSKPIDIFFKMHNAAEHLFNDLDNPDEFRELRQFAEHNAKLKSDMGEVTLEEIYDYFPQHLGSKTDFMMLELLQESEHAFVFNELVALIKELHSMGKLVILISDMYLSADQIRTTFFKNDKTLTTLPLYVSSEYKQNKSSGFLFNTLANENSLVCDKWLHIGDNVRSDVTIPSAIGIHSLHLAPTLDFNRIIDMEFKVFNGTPEFNAVRRLAAIQRPENTDVISYEIGAVVWGPVLVGFADWVIDQTLKAGSNTILCMMREAEVYAPLISHRLAQRKLSGVNVKRLFVSRKSTFWPSIDTTNADWFEELLHTLYSIKGYTVEDFYRDFYIEVDSLLEDNRQQLLRHADSVYVKQQNLLNLLTNRARGNLTKVKDYIAYQRQLFFAYYNRHVQVDYAQCTVVDLGAGGTAHRQLEAIFSHSSAANLLFYSSSRIYKNISKTYFSSYINAGNDRLNLRQLLMRSPECIEVFLVGDCGSTIGYESDGSVILDTNLDQNSLYVTSFLAGVMEYIKLHDALGFEGINRQDVIAIVNRYVQLPTHTEAKLFTKICHQDNFGSNNVYPVVSEKQVSKINAIGIKSYYLQMKKYPRWLVTEIHWPQASLSYIDKNFLFQQTGFLSQDTGSNVLELLNLIIDKGWKTFSIYGAGEFFTLLKPHLNSNNLQIDYVIDRRADVSDSYQVAGYNVISLSEALHQGCERIVISSFAFKDDITQNIIEQSMANNLDSIEVLSL